MKGHATALMNFLKRYKIFHRFFQPKRRPDKEAIGLFVQSFRENTLCLGVKPSPFILPQSWA